MQALNRQLTVVTLGGQSALFREYRRYQEEGMNMRQEPALEGSTCRLGVRILCLWNKLILLIT